MSLTPEQRSMRARAAAYRRWSTVADPAGATQPARRAFRSRFDDEVDPLRQLSEAERQRRSELALRAYMTSLSLASSRARARTQRPARGIEGPDSSVTRE